MENHTSSNAISKCLIKRLHLLFCIISSIKHKTPQDSPRYSYYTTCCLDTMSGLMGRNAPPLFITDLLICSMGCPSIIRLWRTYAYNVYWCVLHVPTVFTFHHLISSNIISSLMLRNAPPVLLTDLICSLGCPCHMVYLWLKCLSIHPSQTIPLAQYHVWLDGM